MSQKTREKYGIRLPVVDSSSRAASAPPPPGAVWNNIRRLWMVDGVACDPQPAAPLVVSFSLDSGRHVSPIPPAVKVTA